MTTDKNKGPASGNYQDLQSSNFDTRAKFHTTDPYAELQAYACHLSQDARDAAVLYMKAMGWTPRKINSFYEAAVDEFLIYATAIDEGVN